MIYADHAATTKLDIDAFEAMKVYLTESYGNPSQPYSFSRDTKKAIKEARETIARCIGANPEEVYFTSGGTESDNWALKGLVKKQNKKRIIVSAIEHHAILRAAESLKREGYDLDILSVTEEGVILPSYLDAIINTETAIVSVMFANNEIGSIQPVDELASITHKNGAIFHSDAVQAVGHVEIDVKNLGIDLLSASAHKFNGPRGIGFLYIKKGVELYPLMDGGAQEMGLRSGTENVASIIGMAVALKKHCSHLSEEKMHLYELEEQLIGGLERTGLQFIRNGSKHHLPGNVSLSFKNSDGEMILHRLDLMGICVSTGSACDSKNMQVSHVIKAIGVPKEYEGGTIRISLGIDNTMSDVKRIIEALRKIVSI